MTTPKTPTYASPKTYDQFNRTHGKRIEYVFAPVSTPWYSHVIMGASLLIILVLLVGMVYMVLQTI